jgi:hypothetical protein
MEKGIVGAMDVIEDYIWENENKWEKRTDT